MKTFIPPSGGYCLSWSLLVLGVAVGLLGTNRRLEAKAPLSFQRDIRPILSDHCFACHGPDENKREAGLRLDQPPSDDGEAAIVAGQPERSHLWERITATDAETVMPPPAFNKPLTDEQRSLLRRWIEEGATYEQHWSFLPPVKPPVPAVGESHAIDAFLQAKLAEVGLKANPIADRRTLLRRLSLDLTGLPPTHTEIAEFLADKSEGAYEKWIDRLFARESYGEHMARYWLDLARYADTHGLHLDNERSMWPYRDWVVRAFHGNLPFDEFTRWQLAGDLLPGPTADQRIASGFNRCNVTTSEGGSINEEWIYRYAVDRTSTMAEVWMGLTAGCAVCHDHKFDPLTSRDYYSLYAFFHSAADPAMDGNATDTPPILRLRSEADEVTVQRLDGELAELRKAYEAVAAAYEYRDPREHEPSPTMRVREVAWFEDDFPKGARLEARDGERTWEIREAGKVFRGERALRQKGAGLTQQFFTQGAEAMTIPSGGKLFAHCYLDPEDPPQAIMLQFHTDGWKHRAIWGKADAIPFGKEEDGTKFVAGDLPALGSWVELEVSPSSIGLKVNSKVTGYAFTQAGGTVIWDAMGVRTKSDITRDPNWSYAAWKEANSGKAVVSLPGPLREIVRGRKVEAWTAEEAKRVYDFWLMNIYVGADDEFGDYKRKLAEKEGEKKAIDDKAPLTFVMADLPQPRQSYVMLRGAYDKPGEEVRRSVPNFLPPLPSRPNDRDYNRLDLANWLVSGQHPLTARVTVNRIWQQFFGVGLVKTSGDFGSQGEPPSHPELLDWLAVQFVEDGWDVQRLIRRIVTSKAYRRQSVVTPEQFELDPENRWLGRGPRLRLDAEVLRDQALAVSGLLVDRVGGPGVKPYQPSDIWEPIGFGNSNTRYYKQGSGEDLYRRSLYTFLKRTAPPPFMSNFDAPNREQSCSYRERSNTPMQALQLMNDIQHVEAARHFAHRMMQEGGRKVERRLRWGWEAVTGRRPTAEELAIVSDTLATHRQRFTNDVEGAKTLVSYGESPIDPTIDVSELAAYTLVANLLLNLDETLCKN
jgi:hypothetical protein